MRKKWKGKVEVPKGKKRKSREVKLVEYFGNSKVCAQPHLNQFKNLLIRFYLKFYYPSRSRPSE